MIVTGAMRVFQWADKTLRAIKSTSFVFGREEARSRHALRIKNRILEVHLSELSNMSIEFAVAQDRSRSSLFRTTIILNFIRDRECDHEWDGKLSSYNYQVRDS